MKSLIFIVSFLLVLTSCTQETPMERKIDRPDTKPRNSSTGSTYMQDLSNTSNKIKDTEEFQSCMKQQTNMCIRSTGNQVALKTKDPSFCRELASKEQQSSCEFAIAMINAQEKNDVAICDTLTEKNYQKQCKVQLYRQEAIAKKDPALCDKINTAFVSTGTGSSTEKNTQKNQCIMQIIMSGSGTTEKDCEKITDTDSNKMCVMMMKNKAKSTAAHLPTPPITTPKK